MFYLYFLFFIINPLRAATSIKKLRIENLVIWHYVSLVHAECFHFVLNSCSGDNEVINVGRDVIVYNTGFYLYMTTKLPNPKFGPGVYNKVTVINFSLTVEGLQDQLLEIVFAKERYVHFEKILSRIFLHEPKLILCFNIMQ